MSSSDYRYNPDDDAVIQAPWNITFLSQRDVNLRVPINYGTFPGVSVTAACFSNGTYEDFATVRCISNLLAAGFRRLSFDLYWDADRQLWSFCPVSLPTGAEAGSGSTIVAGVSQTTRASTKSAANVFQPSSASATQAVTTNTLQLPKIRHRQQTLDAISTTAIQSEQNSMSPVSKATFTIDLEVVGTRPAAVLPTQTPNGATEILYSIGPYTCSTTKATDILTELLPSFLETTDNTLDAVMQFVILNIHAAASIADPLAPAQAPAQDALPLPGDLLGQYFENNASTFLYTPSLLLQDRANLNVSWFNINSKLASPNSEYFNTTEFGGLHVSQNGWPSASYNEFRQDYHRRIVFGYGAVDPQMRGYNFSGDGAVVFQQNYTADFTNIETQSDGTISNGCFYNPESFSLGAANNSWALSALSQDVNNQLQIGASSGYNSSLPALGNLTNCGISPFLNASLLNTTADVSIIPYKYFVYSSVWSWAWGEPLINNTNLRCAFLDPQIAGGRWRTGDCSDEHYAACQNNDEPLDWSITSVRSGYNHVSPLCPPNTSFAVPHTALENRYLLEAYSASAAGQDVSQPLWLDLNSKHVPSCWVVGVNTTCPYDKTQSDFREIYVPTVAGLIILILTVMLIIVKCGANRVHSKRKRKGDHGWDYEGVPS